jgi:hypothetical protein
MTSRHVDSDPMPSRALRGNLTEDLTKRVISI